MNVSFDMYQTLGIATVVLLFGAWLKKKLNILQRFCIPAPVVGGLIYAVTMTIIYVATGMEIDYDDTIKNICMVLFFTSVGFQANVKVLKKGGLDLLLLVLLVGVLVFLQNGTSLLVSGMIGVDPKVGLSTGSIPMIGGHGTAGAFGPILEDFGLQGATTVCTAAATFGLVAGSLMGGPLAQRLIRKYNLLEKEKKEDPSVLIEEEKSHKRDVGMYAGATYQLAIAMGLGTGVSWLLSRMGMTFPVYIGALIVAAIIRNVCDRSKKITIHMGEINDLGGIALSLFLGIAMITLKLWKLAELAFPMIILLAVQTVLMYLFARFIVFYVMGRDYDAAVLTAGVCGFGMGATPNAMANMQAVTDKFGASVKAYILIPIVGGMFTDFINSLGITLFINMI
ncbi:MAG: sodium/glutamate symporter [Eubacterium sp.]|nr:sodium/glutamate symporter [Eubacterium sp.]